MKFRPQVRRGSRRTEARLQSLAGRGDGADVGHDDQGAGEDHLVAGAHALHHVVAHDDVHRARQTPGRHLITASMIAADTAACIVCVILGVML